MESLPNLVNNGDVTSHRSNSFRHVHLDAISEQQFNIAKYYDCKKRFYGCKNKYEALKAQFNKRFVKLGQLSFLTVIGFYFNCC